MKVFTNNHSDFENFSKSTNISENDNTSPLNPKIESKDDEENIRLARKYQFISTLCLIGTCTVIKFIQNHWRPKAHGLFWTNYYGFQRFFFMCICSYFGAKANGYQVKSLIDFGTEFKWMWVKIVSWSITILALAISIGNLKLGTAIVIFMTSPILQNIFSSLLLGEKLEMKYIYSCIISLFGVWVMFMNHTDANQAECNHFIGLLAGIVNSISTAIMYISSKYLQKDFDYINLNYVCTFWCSVLLFINLLLTSSAPSFADYFDPLFCFSCIILAILSYYAFNLLNLALKLADVGKTSYFMYLQLPVLAIIGMIVWAERYTVLELSGGLLILVTLLVTTQVLK